VRTFKTLRASGYTGKVYFIVDNEDATIDQYRRNFGAENVIVFDKKAMADKIDEANNFDNRKVIVHARNASFDIAEDRGITHFVQLDDDYYFFGFRGNCGARTIRKIDFVFDVVLDFLDSTPTLAIAFAQGGDNIGGFTGIKMLRKSMNSFFCRTDRRFMFVGSINEDVNTYVSLGMRGGLFLTFTGLQLDQKDTQSQGGGMTEVYLQKGTYVKSFTSVLFNPSAVRVSMMSTKHVRMHHLITWRATCPAIVPECYRKQDAVTQSYEQVKLI
jgi:hypothetical protein